MTKDQEEELINTLTLLAERSEEEAKRAKHPAWKTLHFWSALAGLVAMVFGAAWFVFTIVQDQRIDKKIAASFAEYESTYSQEKRHNGGIGVISNSNAIASVRASLDAVRATQSTIQATQKEIVSKLDKIISQR